MMRRMLLKRRSRRRPEPEVRPGLPESLPADVLEHAILRETGTVPQGVRHQHLSGWKRAGAYRLLVETKAGSTSLIFKDARYSGDHLASLDGLPVRPGRPELAVYSCHDTPLKAWMPRALWTCENVPGEHYLYLLEDLHPDFVTPTGDEALVAVCGELPRLHRELDEVLGHSKELLRYDGTFGDSLLGYATNALTDYAREADDRQVGRLLGRWDAVEWHFRRILDDAHERLATLPVHGDLNLANVLTATDGSGELRLLDWEWSGYGLPHLDLAAALKAADRQLEHRALTAYHQAESAAQSYDQLWRTYQACKLLRVLLDASFFARQQLAGARAERFDLSRYIRSSVSRAGRALDELQRAGQRARK